MLNLAKEGADNNRLLHPPWGPLEPADLLGREPAISERFSAPLFMSMDRSIRAACDLLWPPEAVCGPLLGRPRLRVACHGSPSALRPAMALPDALCLCVAPLVLWLVPHDPLDRWAIAVVRQMQICSGSPPAARHG